VVQSPPPPGGRRPRAMGQPPRCGHGLGGAPASGPRGRPARRRGAAGAPVELCGDAGAGLLRAAARRECPVRAAEAGEVAEGRARLLLEGHVVVEGGTEWTWNRNDFTVKLTVDLDAEAPINQCQRSPCKWSAENGKFYLLLGQAGVAEFDSQ
ncbi:unnamed protein product, partial [Prorocentrum cordatum]